MKLKKINLKVYGDSHPTIASDIINLGSLYQAMGKTEKARSCFLRGYEIRKQWLGENHDDTISAKSFISNPVEAKSICYSIVHRKCF